LKSEQLQASIAVGMVILVAAMLASIASGADHPVSAAGIALQTLAGLAAAIQLWANNASDAMVRWAARQVERNRWRVARLFDGSLKSLLLSTAWCALGYIVIRAPFGWVPAEAIAWPLVVLALLTFATGIVVFMGSLLVYVSAQVLEQQSLPDGRAMTTLQSRIAENDWIWPLVGLAFLLGGILQIAVA
jgi:ABC-type uncharacterized transport system permease subunit